MRSKWIIIVILICTMYSVALCQFDRFNSFEELNSLAHTYLQKQDYDSLIILDEYAKIRFPEYDEGLTYMLSFLYSETDQDSMILENWIYGLKKRYFFGIRDWRYNQFENNAEFHRLVKIDRQIGDSLSNLAHMEYEIVLPENYSTDSKYPILFIFHGNNRNLRQAKSVWTSKVIQERFIAVYLQSYIHMSKRAFQWKLNDERSNREFKEIYEQITDSFAVNKNKVVYLGMSAGGRQAIDYAFNKFLPVNGLVLNCPVIPDLSDSSIYKFADEKNKIAIITGENDWALESQKKLIYQVDSLGENGNITISVGVGHEFAGSFSTSLDNYLDWILE